MAVYTHITQSDAEKLLKGYDIGTFKSLTGIIQGVENSNYFLETIKNGQITKYVLTLFERRVRKEDIPFYLGVMDGFAAHGLQVPSSIVDKNGETIQNVADRPAVIISFLNGAQRMLPTFSDCAAMGSVTAQMHKAANTIPLSRTNGLSLIGWSDLAAQCVDRADECTPGLQHFIETELDWLKQHWPMGLPTGIIHADLFPDNVFFNGNEISGIIDFYFSCTDIYIYDLAICLVSWCWQNDNWIPENASAFLHSYQKKRPLNHAEKNAFLVVMRGASFRFLLTRLYDWINQVDGADVKIKDPTSFLTLSNFLISNPSLFGENNLD